MAVGDDLARSLVTEHPRGAQADDDPFGIDEVLVGFGEMDVDLFEKCFFGGAPKVSVMAEGAIKLPSHFDDFIMMEWLGTLQAIERIRHAARVVERSEGIHLRIEAQATAQTAHFVGEARAQEEEIVGVDDGLLQRSDIDWGG